jgi:uridine kinase
MIFKNKMKWLTSRGIFVILFAPTVQNQLFAPFLAQDHVDLFDPWTNWLDSEGRSDAFPYGPIMYAFFSLIPMILFAFQELVGTIDVVTAASSLITLLLLLVDYYLTSRILEELKDKKWVSNALLFSPFLLYATYVLGMNDVLPALSIFLMGCEVTKNRWSRVGLYFGITLCLKMGLVVILPFVLIYLVGIKNSKQIVAFAKGFVPFLGLALLPLAWSSGYMEMVLRSPEFLRSLDFSIKFGALSIYLLPVGYFAILLAFWSLRRTSQPYLLTFISISLLTIATLQVRSVGWFLWGLFLSTHLIGKIRNRILFLFYVWQLTAVGFYLYKSNLIEFRLFNDLSWFANESILSLLFTINLTLSALLIYKLFSEASYVLDPYFLEKKPLSIAIAGDSGVGKDTLCIGLSHILNDDSISYILGDDYHVEERNGLIWNKRTHLDASANELSRFNRDIGLILRRKTVSARHYDHGTGKFTPLRLIQPRDFLLVNGLHALTVPEVTSFDLKVFMKIEESLRIKLKVQRDVQMRGHSNEASVRASIARRKSDARKYVDSQSDLADLVIETKFRSQLNPSSVYFHVQAKEVALLFEFHKVLQAINPEVSWFVDLPLCANVLVLNPQTYSKHNHELLLKESIPNFSELVPISDFTIVAGSLVASICLFFATKRREYINGR